MPALQTVKPCKIIKLYKPIGRSTQRAWMARPLLHGRVPSQTSCNEGELCLEFHCWITYPSVMYYLIYYNKPFEVPWQSRWNATICCFCLVLWYLLDWRRVGDWFCRSTSRCCFSTAFSTRRKRNVQSAGKYPNTPFWCALFSKKAWMPIREVFHYAVEFPKPFETHWTYFDNSNRLQESRLLQAPLLNIPAVYETSSFWKLLGLKGTSNSCCTLKWRCFFWFAP